jgi:starch synthase
VLPPPRLYSALRRRTVGARGGEPLTGLRGSAVKRPTARLGTYLATPLSALARVIRNERCDALLCQEYEYPRFDACVLFGRSLGVPVFGTFQGSLGSGHPLERLLRRRAIRASAGLIAPTAEERRRVSARYGLAAEQVAPIPNPLDAEAWSPSGSELARAELGLPATARVAVWHGRVRIREKGLDVLLEAWARVRRERPDIDAHLLLVGGGDDAPWLRAEIERRRAGGVTWADRYVLDRETIRRRLSAGDVYVLPSRQEGSPVALLEAMACGLPAVAADASGVADILPAGERSGGIVVPRSDPVALSRALAELLGDPERASAAGRRARARVEEWYSLEAVGTALRDFLLAPDSG